MAASSVASPPTPSTSSFVAEPTTGTGVLCPSDEGSAVHAGLDWSGEDEARKKTLTREGGTMELSLHSPHEDCRHRVDPEHFRRVMGCFASGVTVITTRDTGIDYGLTANAVSSLSLDPPMLLICVNKTSNTHKAITRSGIFAVNILRENQSEVARQFARSDSGKFTGLPLWYGELGTPLLLDALATIECRVVEMVAGGTHTVFLAEVEAAQATGGMPLTYCQGGMGRFAFIKSEQEASLWRQMQWEEIV
jgi:flavin reductase (DIM6/NTAB) family NADH-FMN oxidoreductase RutF